MERVLVLLVDRPRRRPRRLLPARAHPQSGPGHALVLRPPRRRVAGDRREPVAVRRLRPRRRVRVRPMGAAVLVATGNAHGDLPARGRGPHRDRSRCGRAHPAVGDLAATPTTDRFGTGTGGDLGSDQYPASRFEQSLAVAGRSPPAARRDRCARPGTATGPWGPRNWRVTFTLGDLQAENAQLYFVGAPQPGERAGAGTSVTRRACGTSCASEVRSSTTTRHARSRHPRVRFEAEDGAPLDVELDPVSPSISFDLAHTCEEPEHWLYWRILVEARCPPGRNRCAAGSRPVGTAAPERAGSARRDDAVGFEPVEVVRGQPAALGKHRAGVLGEAGRPGRAPIVAPSERKERQ